MAVPKMLTPAEVAECLRVKESTLANWRYRKVGPRPTKTGHLVRYDERHVEAYLRAQTRAA
jgi:predicted DNA-binding transcriptional regulator AlpA